MKMGKYCFSRYLLLLARKIQNFFCSMLDGMLGFTFCDDNFFEEGEGRIFEGLFGRKFVALILCGSEISAGFPQNVKQRFFLKISSI